MLIQLLLLFHTSRIHRTLLVLLCIRRADVGVCTEQHISPPDLAFRKDLAVPPRMAPLDRCDVP